MTLAFAAVALLAAGAPEREVLSAEPGASVVRFHVDHKLHQVDGESRSVEGKAVVEPDGRVLAMVRIPVATFDSGDGNRDSHMRQALEASRHPFVVFKGVGEVKAPLTAGETVTAVLAGELDFHGVRRPVKVPVTLDVARDGSAEVRGTMAISLDDYRVERPSLLFVKLEDACTISFDLKMRRAS
jgi:polyisoprenoid-binding protein YceI